MNFRTDHLVEIDEHVAAGLRSQLIGRLLLPEDPLYEHHRQVYNGAIDRRPAAIVVCRGVTDVQRAVTFAHQLGVPIGIRGGGHSVAGHGTCDGGLLIDLREMHGIWVDRREARVWVQGGATLRDLDAATQVMGLAVPTGQVSATGIAGLTLNGGMGMLQRRFGLTSDNLQAVRLVDAAGVLREVDDETDPELMWALRGGGGNFGVVTDFCFNAHAVGPEILAGMIAWPVDRFDDVLACLDHVMGDAPLELSADIIFQQAPPLEVFPPELLGSQLAGIFIRWTGDLDEGATVVDRFRSLSDPVLDLVAPMTYADVQRLLDPLNPDGNGHYWTGSFVRRMDAETRQVLGRLGSTLPTPMCIIEVIPFNGAVTQIKPTATAFCHREESWLVHILGQWADPAEEQKVTHWVRQAKQALATLGYSGESYLNLVMDDETEERVEAFWQGDRMRMLSSVKARLDPGNVFRYNHNIAPADRARD